jgi:hypothetical protein
MTATRPRQAFATSTPIGLSSGLSWCAAAAFVKLTTGAGRPLSCWPWLEAALVRAKTLGDCQERTLDLWVERGLVVLSPALIARL